MNEQFSRLVGDHLLRSEVKEERWKFMRDILIGAAALLALLVAATWPTGAHAVQLDRAGCQGFAVWSHDVVLMRDLGADKEKLRAYLESKRHDVSFYPLLLKLLDGLWAATGDKEELAQKVYSDCIDRRGQYGTDT